MPSLAPGIVYLRGLVAANIRFLVLTAVLAGAVVAADEIARAPRFAQEGLVSVSDLARPTLGGAIATEIVSLTNRRMARSKAGAGLFGSAFLNEGAARVRTYGSPATAEVEVRGRSEEEVRKDIADFIEFLHDQYKDKIALARQRAEDRRAQLSGEIASVGKDLDELRQESAFLRRRAAHSPEIAAALAELGVKLAAKQDRMAGLRAELHHLDGRSLAGPTFEFVGSSASPLPVGPAALFKRSVTASLLAFLSFLCLLIVRDAWRAGST